MKSSDYYSRNYITIADWMLNLKLNTRELLCYAIIYGFSQDSDGAYYGSLDYLAGLLGLGEHRQNALRYLSSLTEKNLVIKTKIKNDDRQVQCYYRTVFDMIPKFRKKDVDYINIQPWMMSELGLNGKDLLLYAVVHGYSRKDSHSYCAYSKTYLSKWMECRKDNVSRQVDRLVKSGLIRIIDTADGKGLVAVVPGDDELTQTENTSLSGENPQIENTFTQNENGNSLKLRTNNIYANTLNDNLLPVAFSEVRSYFDLLVEEGNLPEEARGFVYNDVVFYELSVISKAYMTKYIAAVAYDLARIYEAEGSNPPDSVLDGYRLVNDAVSSLTKKKQELFTRLPFRYYMEIRNAGERCAASEDIKDRKMYITKVITDIISDFNS